MARIELEATDADIVERLAILLRETQGHQYGTTAALGLSTAIFAWVAKRIRRQDDPLAESIRSAWEAELGGDAPWCFPDPLAQLSVTEALVRIRNASSHADGGSVQPVNDRHLLRGFAFDADQVPFSLQEDELRRIGMTVANEFVLRMRGAQEVR